MKKIMEMNCQGRPMRGLAVFSAIVMAVCGIAIAAGGGDADSTDPTEYDDTANHCKYSIYEETNKAVLTEFYGYITQPSVTVIADFNGESYDVTVSEDVFKNNTALTALTIEGSDTSKCSIEDNAFSGCTSLTTVNIGNRETTVGSSAFSGCTALTDLKIESGAKKKEFGQSCFSGCTELTALAIPDSPVTFGDYAFSGLSGLVSLTFPGEPRNKDYVAAFGTEALRYTGLTSIAFPSSEVSLGESQFEDMAELVSVTFDGEVSIGTMAFGGTGLTSLRIPTAKEIGWNAFAGSSLIEMEIICFNGKIPYSAFYCCKKLTTVLLPAGTETEDSAFGYCVSLTQVPANIKKVGNYAFSDCTGLVEVGSEDIEEIGRSAFVNCTNLEKISIPNVSSIEKSAFEGCTSLTEIGMSGATKIGTYAFRGCSALTEIEIPKSVTEVQTFAFKDCTELSSVTFESGSSLNNIGGGAHQWDIGRVFDGTKITSITLPASLTRIDKSTFDGLSQLTSVAFSNEAASDKLEIESSAFAGTGISSISFPQSEVVIKNYVFKGCTSLEDVNIPNASGIWGYAFQGCTGIENIVFGDNLATLDGDAFKTYGTSEEAVTFYGKIDDDGQYAEKLDVTPDNMKGFTFVGTNKELVRVCTLKLHYPGVEEPTVKQYKSGAAIVEPEKPSPAEKFQYWAENGAKFSFTDAKMPGRNVDLYPIFKVVVSYKDDSGTTYCSEEKLTGEETTLPDESGEVKKSGHVLVGWKIDGDERTSGIGEFYTVDSIDDIDIVAVWYKGTDVAVFISDGDKIDGDTYVPLVDGKAKLNSRMTTSEWHYEFYGWCRTDGSGNEVYYAQGMTLEASGTVRLTPYFIVYHDDYTHIYYDYGRGSGDVHNQFAEPGKKIMLPTSDDARYEGYRLAGWKVGDELITAPYEVPMSYSWPGVTITAVWEAVSTVTFEDTDGTVLKELTIPTGETIELCDGEGLPEHGTALVGWRAGGSETVYRPGSNYRVDSNIVFTAVRAETADALIYVTDGGILNGDAYTPIIGGTAVLNATVEKDGYVFLGWLMEDADGNVVAYANGMSIEASGTVRLKAYLVSDDAEVYEVRYDLGDGRGSVTSQKAEEGKLIALPTSRDVHCEGYTLAGWEVSAATSGMMISLGAEPTSLGAETITGPYYTVTSEDVTISAVWESDAPSPTPEPPWWDDDYDDEPVVIPDGNTDNSTSEETDKVVAVAVAASIAASLIMILAFTDLRRK